MSSSSEDVSWINWFCGHRGHEFLCRVPEEYIQQSFNLTGLPELVPHYKQSLETILDLDMESEDEREQSEEVEMEIEQSAELLYGLIHARLVENFSDKVVKYFPVLNGATESTLSCLALCSLKHNKIYDILDTL